MSQAAEIIRRITLPHENALRLKYDLNSYLLLRNLYVSTFGYFNHSINRRLALIRPPQTSIDNFFSPNQDIASSLSTTRILDQLLNKGGYASSLLNLDSYNLSDIKEFVDTRSFSKFKNQACARACLTHIPTLFELPLIKHLIYSDTFRVIADNYLQTQSVLNMVSLCKSVHVKRNAQQLSQDAMLFHFDSDHNRFLKIFIYLSDVNRYCGPHTYIPRTSLKYRVSLPDTIQSDNRHSNLSITRSGLVPEYICGPSGTVIFADTHNLHRGTPISHGHSRYILQLQYVDSMFGSERTCSNEDIQLINPNIDFKIS